MAKNKGIYKRGKVYWIRYKGIDGRILRESTGSTKFTVAEILLNKRRSAIDSGEEEVTKIQNHSFNELAKEYLVWCQRQRNYGMKKTYIKYFVERYGNLPLKRFNTMLVEQFQTHKAQEGSMPATINRYVATLKHMFTKAEDWEMVSETVVKKVKKVKMLEENNKRLRYLSKEEAQELLSHCPPYIRPLVVVALNTGMRSGEIKNLTWRQVDLKHGFILLEITKNGERREIPINKTLRREFQNVKRRLDVPYVFFNELTEKPFDDIRKAFNTALKKSNIHDFKFHDLRHTFASHSVMAGVDLSSLQRLLGHKTLDMTMRYAHLAPQHLRNAVDLLDERLNETSTAQLLHNLPKNSNNQVF